MGKMKKVISMARCDNWTSFNTKPKKESLAGFCLDRCPHDDKPCDGDCPEMKEFRKNYRGKKNGKQ